MKGNHKMKDILEVFFTKQVNATKTSADLERRIENLGEQFIKKLNEEENDLFVDYTDAHFHFLNHCSVENFKQGFWVGCRFMQEMMES
jgi:hypothetical protein